MYKYHKDKSTKRRQRCFLGKRSSHEAAQDAPCWDPLQGPADPQQCQAPGSPQRTWRGEVLRQTQVFLPANAYWQGKGVKLPEEKEKEQQAQSHETAKQMEKNISPTKKYSTDRAGKKKIQLSS